MAPAHADRVGTALAPPALLRQHRVQVVGRGARETLADAARVIVGSDDDRLEQAEAARQPPTPGGCPRGGRRAPGSRPRRSAGRAAACARSSRARRACARISPPASSRRRNTTRRPASMVSIERSDLSTRIPPSYGSGRQVAGRPLWARDGHVAAVEPKVPRTAPSVNMGKTVQFAAAGQGPARSGQTGGVRPGAKREANNRREATTGADGAADAAASPSGTAATDAERGADDARDHRARPAPDPHLRPTCPVPGRQLVRARRTAHRARARPETPPA